MCSAKMSIMPWLPIFLASLVSTNSQNVSLPFSGCNPMLCECSSDGLSANCSSKGFFSVPSGLPKSLHDLDLSHNKLMRWNISAELLTLKELKSLDLSGNNLNSLQLSTASHFNLQELDLSENNVSSVRALSLSGFISLVDLNLAFNTILSLPSKAFSDSKHLVRLNLKGNSMMNLEPGCLDDLEVLEELNLSRNRLSALPTDLFKGLRSLRVLELNKNRFVEIPGLSFHGLDNLRVLKLKRNSIEYLRDGAFFGLSNIEELHLDRNKIQSVHKGWLYGVYSLTYLGLAFNKVDYIRTDGWEFCRELLELDLRSNKMQLIDQFSFQMLPKLRKLSLQNNLISHLEGQSAFSSLVSLEELYLDNNDISHTIEDMRGVFSALGNLRVLSLSDNEIKSVGAKAFLGLPNLIEIDLGYNSISTVQRGAFETLAKLKVVKINSGSMLCDCHLKWLQKFVNETNIRGVNDARCAHPQRLKNKRVTEVAYEDYTCDDFPKPYILKHPRTQISLKGDDLRLSCRAASTSEDEMSFEWRIDDEVIELPHNCDEFDSGDRNDMDDSSTRIRTSSSSMGCIKTEQHSFDGKGRELSSLLLVRNISYSEAGRYQCVVRNSFGITYSDRANITVYVYPEFVVVPESKTLHSGSNAALKCAARGVPSPNVGWSKDNGLNFPAASERRINVNNFVPPNDRNTIVNSFVIYNIKAEDAGIYTCSAKNPAGTITWNITIEVLQQPLFLKPLTNKEVAIGSSAVMECLAQGSPAPLVQWKHEGELIESSERHFFTASNQLLIIVKVNASDAGRYECEVGNSLGTLRQEANLTILSNKHHLLASPSSSTSSESFKDDEASSIVVMEENSMLFIILAAGLICVVLTSLVWTTIIVHAKRRRRAYNNCGGSRSAEHDIEVVRPNNRLLTSTSHDVSKSGAVDLFKTPRSFSVHSDESYVATQASFDIQEHVRLNLARSRNNRRETGRQVYPTNEGVLRSVVSSGNEDEGVVLSGHETDSYFVNDSKKPFLMTTTISRTTLTKRQMSVPTTSHGFGETRVRAEEVERLGLRHQPDFVHSSNDSSEDEDEDDECEGGGEILLRCHDVNSGLKAKADDDDLSSSISGSSFISDTSLARESRAFSSNFQVPRGAASARFVGGHPQFRSNNAVGSLPRVDRVVSPQQLGLRSAPRREVRRDRNRSLPRTWHQSRPT